MNTHSCTRSHPAVLLNYSKIDFETGENSKAQAVVCSLLLNHLRMVKATLYRSPYSNLKYPWIPHLKCHSWRNYKMHEMLAEKTGYPALTCHQIGGLLYPET